MVPLTRMIGEFVAGLRFDAIPESAVRSVCNGFTDYAATTILGRDTPVAETVRSVCTIIPGGGEARVCFTPDGASTAEAALINGAAGHALDYDDIGIGVHPAHPSVAMAPAILAEAEVLARSGREMVAAYIAGYEVWGELGRRDSHPHLKKGWHATAIFGAVAAAAAAAQLHGLDARRCSHAIGIAASQAGGLVGNFGSMTKPFHAGRAAQVGILSARLAAAGLTAGTDVIEGNGGFLRAFSPAGEVDIDSPPIFGRDWWILEHGLGFKLYPMCYATHRSLDGILDLIASHPFTADEVASIDVVMGRAQMINLVNHDPQTALEAKFSEEFALAMAVIARRATMEELTDAFVRRDDVQALMKKVKVTVDPGPGGDRPDFPADDGVTVTLTDGRRLERKFDFPRGHPTRPVTPEVLWTKFADCTRGAMPMTKARRLYDRLQSLDELVSVSDLPPVEPSPRHMAL